jgi:DNA polymerase-3 subunit gamma/tau
VGGVDWHALQDQLELGGMNRELALNSELLAVEGDVFRLRLDGAFVHLLKLNKNGVEKLQEALTAHLGRPLRVQLDVGDIATETPARRNQALKAERLALARDALAHDPFVHELQNRFAASLDEASVKAV